MTDVYGHILNPTIPIMQLDSVFTLLSLLSLLSPGLRQISFRAT